MLSVHPHNLITKRSQPLSPSVPPTLAHAMTSIQGVCTHNTCFYHTSLPQHYQHSMIPHQQKQHIDETETLGPNKLPFMRMLNRYSLACSKRPNIQQFGSMSHSIEVSIKLRTISTEPSAKLPRPLCLCSITHRCTTYDAHDFVLDQANY